MVGMQQNLNLFFLYIKIMEALKALQRENAWLQLLLKIQKKEKASKLMRKVINQELIRL